MKIATTSIAVLDFKYQLIFGSNADLVGVNLLYGKKILLKKRFEKPCFCSSREEAEDLANHVILEFLMSK